jgi:hypothetical protein
VHATEILLTEVGTEAGGFRVIGPPRDTLRIELWGFWGPDVADALTCQAPAVSQQIQRAASFTLDAANLKPQGLAGQQALRMLFRALAPISFTRGVLLASNVLTRMQLTRLVRECGLDARVGFGDSPA